MLPNARRHCSALSLIVTGAACILVACTGGVASPWLITFAPAVFLLGWSGGPSVALGFSTCLFLYLVSTVGTTMTRLPPGILRDDLLAVGLVGLASSLGFLRWIRPASGSRVVADKVRWQRQLGEMTQAIGIPQDLEASSGLVLLGVDQIMRAAGRAVLLRTPDGLHLDAASAAGLPDSFVGSFRLTIGSGALSERLARGEIVVGGCDMDELSPLQEFDTSGRTFLLCPLRSGDILVGALYLSWTGNHSPDSATLNRLQEFAKVAALSLQHLLAAHEARQTSGTDPVTGLYSYNMFQLRLQDEAAHSARSQNPVSCLVFEVRDLGAIQARYGDEMRENVLVAAALGLKLRFRAGDFPARSTGDRFAVLSPGLGPDFLPGVARRILVSMECAIREHTGLDVMVAVGSATYPEDTQSIQDLHTEANLDLLAAWEPIPALSQPTEPRLRV